MAGSIIGDVLGIGGTIFGGIKASQAMKKFKNNLETQQKQNQDWYNRRYNEDATQRADAQRMITKTEEAMKSRSKRAAGAAAVTGATEEAAAATKAANAAALADVASSVTANAERRKDAIENQYMATDANLTNQLNNLEAQKAQGIAQSVQGLDSAAADIAENFQ